MQNSYENLLKETVEKLKSKGLSPKNVLFVANDKAYMTWDEFASMSNFEYDAGYGGSNIDLSLYIVGDNWWLERAEYDGSEWWAFKTLPTRPEKHEVFDPREGMWD